jgi:hypothetical protein
MPANIVVSGAPERGTVLPAELLPVVFPMKSSILFKNSAGDYAGYGSGENKAVL